MTHAVTEASVVRATVRVLNSYGAVHWNVGATNGATGLPDRMAILPGGRLLCMEFKRPHGGRVSPKQQWWLDRMSAAGALCLVVTDALQVAEILAENAAETPTNPVESGATKTPPHCSKQPGARHPNDRSSNAA